MTAGLLEERVSLLEREVQHLKQQIGEASPLPWWEQISGAFADTPAFDQAVLLGRQYRTQKRQPPAIEEETDVSA